jgi:hypothetical protein
MLRVAKRGACRGEEIVAARTSASDIWGDVRVVPDIAPLIRATGLAKLVALSRL